ncbi:MFS transporter [Nocardia sp. NPDC023852]|uniref:MFS transporter n=1 Tax=Nocardia sp. NPDC023852 TaxID=3154697 RepID=UPI0033EFC914
MPALLSVLRHEQYRRLFTAQVVALVGTGLLTVALGLLAYDIAGSDAGAVLGTALGIKMVAYVAVAPVISAVTDRVPRKIVLVSADAVRAVIALLLPIVGQVWQIYVLIFLLQAASATFTPTFQSVIPSVLVEEEDYTRGLSLSRLAYDLESLLSPVLAAALLTMMSYNLLFLGTVAGFVASALLVISTTLPRLVPADRSDPLMDRITRGARTMLSRPVLRGLLAMNLAVAAATALVLVNTVVYVRDMLGGSNTSVAIALGCYGAGSMLVALLVPRLLSTVADRRLMMTGATTIPLGLAAVTVVLAVSPSPRVGWVMLGLLWVALGAGTSMINTPSARLLRAQSEPDNRTSVFAAQFSLSHACFMLTYPIAGWVGASISQLAAALTLAVVATLAAIAAARVWPTSVPAAPELVAVGGR